MNVRNRFSERVRVVVSEPAPGERAKQSFKDECDINLIMKRYVKTGVITHVNRYEASYGVVPAQTYHEAMETVRQAREMFDEVPAQIRKKFGNDPEAFLAFVSDEANVEEMRKLGMAKPIPEKVKDPMEVLGDRIEAVLKADREGGEPE